MSTEPHSIPRCAATSLARALLARPANSIRCLRPSASTCLGVTPLLTVASPSLPVPLPTAPGRPALDGPLVGAFDGEGVGRHVLGDCRTGGGLGPAPDRHGSYQHGIRSDEGAVADGRAVLAGPVVVDEHGAGADVGPGADVGVADVAEVRDLGPGADDRVLDLDEGPCLGSLLEPGAGAQGGEGADRHPGADDRGDGHGLGDGGVVADGTADQAHVGPEPAAGPDSGPGLQEGQGGEHGVLADLD